MTAARYRQALLALTLLSLACCSSSCKKPTPEPEPEGLSNAYGTSAPDYTQQMIADNDDGVLILASTELNGPPDLLGVRVDDNGYTPWGTVSSLGMGRFSTFGLHRTEGGELWTGVSAGNRLLAVGRLNATGGLPEIRGVSLDPVRVDNQQHRAFAHGMCPAPDGDFYLAGSVYDDTRTDDLLLVRLGRDGSLRWAKAWGTSGNETLTDAAATSDGGCVAVGFEAGGAGRLLLLSVDALGRPRWSRHFAADRSFSQARIRPTATGFLIIAQASRNPGPQDAACLIEIDESGQITKSQLISADGRLIPKMAVKSGDGWAIVGSFEPAALDRGADAFWLRVDATLNPAGAFLVGGQGIEDAAAVALTERGGYWIGGSSESFDQSADVFVVRVNDRNEARCHQRGLAVQASSPGITTADAELVERPLSYFLPEHHVLDLRNDIARNRPANSQPCSN